MTALLALISLLGQGSEPPAVRFTAVYRCSTSEGESKFFGDFVHDVGFNLFCIEPKVGKSAREVMHREGVSSVTKAKIDTFQNLSWRNRAIDLINGKLSPAQWLKQTGILTETVHFLSSPKTPPLREAMGRESMRSVQAELLVLAWPGVPCFTSDDLGETRYLPGPGPLESWILAMRDLLGPMIYLRATHLELWRTRLSVIRADKTPGLLIFRYGEPQAKRITFYLNTGPTPVSLRGLSLDHVTINRGLDVEEKEPRILPHGFIIEDQSD